MNTISYDQTNDILAIHEGFSPDERFKGNIDAGDLILDISTRGRVRGIEVMNATRFFKDFNVGEETLRNLTDARLDAVSTQHGYTLGIVLKAKGKEIPAKVVVMEKNIL
jgi:hypothetical protein